MTNDIVEVKLTKVPGTPVSVVLNGDCSIECALKVAGLNPEGYEIRVNGDESSLSSTLKEGDIVYLIKKIKGN